MRAGPDSAWGRWWRLGLLTMLAWLALATGTVAAAEADGPPPHAAAPTLAWAEAGDAARLTEPATGVLELAVAVAGVPAGAGLYDVLDPSPALAGKGLPGMAGVHVMRARPCPHDGEAPRHPPLRPPTS